MKPRIEDGVETIAALPVGLGIGLVENIEIDAGKLGFGLHQKLAERSEPLAGGVHLHRLLVGEHHAAVLDRDLLGSEEQLRRSDPHRHRRRSRRRCRSWRWTSWSRKSGGTPSMPFSTMSR